MKTVIDPGQNWALEISEIKASKELLYFFTWRNFIIRYKQTIIGGLWAVVRPLVLMVVFTLVFNKVAKIDSGSESVPYPIFSYAGLLYWNYFSQTVTQVSTSLVTYQGIIKKIYFPRLLVPISTALTGLIDFAVSLLIYFGLVFYYGISISVSGVLLFVPLVLMSFFTVLGVGLVSAAMNVRYRDVAQLMPFVVQVLLFLTPVIYPVNIMPAAYQWILFLNPMAGVIELARYSMLGVGELNFVHIGISLASMVVMFVLGMMLFKSQERGMGDLI